MPFGDEFTLYHSLRWTWRDCQETPLDVREVFLMRLEAISVARQRAADAARSAAEQK